jgi:hypothetical protein
LARRISPVSNEDAKRIIVDGIRKGHTLKDILKVADKAQSTYNTWRANDSDFKKACDIARHSLAGVDDEQRLSRAGEFAEFRRKYLGLETFPHQQQWIDLIEGREPQDLHPSIRYEKGSSRHILINCPPEHSKTMTISSDYVTYRICKQPNIRVLVVSKTQEFAKQILYSIKQRLTSPDYAQLQMDFAPAEGFNGPGSIWQAATVYLGSDARSTREKDPTLAALGIGGQTYGRRCDLIIVDDAIVLSNANAYESQIRWTQQELLTRLGPGGKLIVAGTRVDSIDFYRELRNPERYPDGKSPWTYLGQPAVLSFADKKEDWVTLWPKSNVPWDGLEEDDPDNLPDENGLYPRWTGERLYHRRGLVDARTWSMVYQQQEVSDAAIFDVKTVRSCVNGNRTAGLMRDDNPYHRKGGMNGLYVICSMDPAMTGDTAAIVYGIDMQTQKRYVIDAVRMPSPTPQSIKSLIMTWTDKYSPNTWVIEKNAFQLYLTRDEEIRSYLANRGVSMLEHYTGSNKIDPDFGVASVAPLFTEQLIELPSSHNSEGVKALIEQLVTWMPGVKGKDLKMDLPMALWFAELKARLMVENHRMKSASHFSSKYMPRYRTKRQNVVYLDDLMEEAV